MYLSQSEWYVIAICIEKTDVDTVFIAYFGAYISFYEQGVTRIGIRDISITLKLDITLFLWLTLQTLEAARNLYWGE